MIFVLSSENNDNILVFVGGTYNTVTANHYFLFYFIFIYISHTATLGSSQWVKAMQSMVQYAVTYISANNTQYVVSGTNIFKVFTSHKK